MCNLRWIVGFLFCFSCLRGKAETPLASNQQVATNVASSNDNTATSALDVKLSAKAQEAAAVATDDVIEFAKKAGDQNKATVWQSRKGQPFTIGDVRALLNVMEDLRDKSQLLSAQQLYEQLQIIADSLQDDFPALSILIQIRLSCVDDAFERYDVGLHRIDDVESIFQRGGTKVPTYKPYAFYPVRGHLLRELGMYDEAAQFDLRYLSEANKYPAEVANRTLPLVKFELRAVYADTGAFDKLAELGAAQTVEFNGADGNVDSHRIFLMESSIAKYHISGDKDLSEAEAKCQDLVDRIKYYRGVSSTLYIQAIELMSKVKIAQSQHADALALLEKSSDLRAGLFEPDHPSVARTKAEIDRVRKLAVSAAIPSP
jgi:hypothetical protein